MKYFGKSSIELSENDFSELSGIFNQVYNRNINASFLRNKYSSPCLGYSFHGLMCCDKGRLVGAITIIPFSYSFFEKQIMAGCVVDLMIHEDFRKDLLSIKHLYESALMKSEGVLDFLYAVPNSNAYLYWTKFLKWKDLGQLHYFIHVLNISKIEKRLSAFSKILKMASGFLNLMIFDHRLRKTGTVYPICKISDNEYKKYRFRKDYIKVSESDNWAYYSIVDESSVKTAYLIDLSPVSKEWLGKVVKEIRKNENDVIDIIMYIGNKIMTPVNLLKVPRRFEPRVLNLIGNALSEKVDDRIYDLTNWIFNLSDFDVR